MTAANADRLLAALALLAGAGGVALSAAAAHLGTGASLDTAARFMLVHAAALLAVMAAIHAGLLHATVARIAAWALLVGLLLFSGDLSVRSLYGVAPLPMAAPSGGFLLIGGWCLAAVAALLPNRVR